MPRSKQFDEQEVLEKAMHLFWRDGFHATSIQNLVDHLGINRASLYDTYGGKEALFEKAFEHYATTYSRLAGKLLEKHDSVKKGFEELLLSTARYVLEDQECKGCFVVNTTTEMVPASEQWMEQVSKNKQVFESLFLKHLQRGVNQGEIPPDKNLKALSSFLFTFYNGLQVISKTKPSEKELTDMLRLVLSALE